jgi:hypothetical protein
MYSFDVKPGGDRSSRTSFGGIEVVTEMTVVQEDTKHPHLESTSERRLVMDA